MTKCFKVGFHYETFGHVFVKEVSEARAIALVDNHLAEHGLDFDYKEGERGYGATNLTTIDDCCNIDTTLPKKEDNSLYIRHWSKNNMLDNGIVMHGSTIGTSSLPALVAHAVSLGYFFSVSPNGDKGDLTFMYDNRRLIGR
jgi:hypothetical protein